MKTLGRIVWAKDQERVICLAIEAAQQRDGGPAPTPEQLPFFGEEFVKGALLAHRGLFNDDGRRVADSVLARLDTPCRDCDPIVPDAHETCPSCGRGAKS